MTLPIIPDYDFGKSTDYSAWQPNTTITLCNVPWNNDYRDIVKWPNRQALDAYIDGLPNHRVTLATYAKVHAPISIDLPFALANKYNYVTVKNPVASFSNSADEPTHFYYFVTDVSYSAPDTTRIVVQLDLWTTFGFGVTFGRCFIERGHIGIANENNFENFGRTYLTEPEGLDTGSDLRTVIVRKNLVMDTQGTQTGTNSDKPMVLIMSSSNLGGGPAEHGDLTNPINTIAEPGAHAGIPLGLGVFIMSDVQSFYNLITRLKDKPWVIEGIKSITMIPNIDRYGITAGGAGADGISWRWLLPDGRPIVKQTQLWTDWRNEISPYIPARYRHLNKLKTFPYMAIEMTTWNGSNVILRPELWRSANAQVAERVSIVPPAQRIVFSPYKYNAYQQAYTDPQGDDWGEFMSMSVTIDQFPTVPIMNDAATLALAQNARGMAFERQSAEWAQQRTQAGISTSYDQATSSISASADQTALANRSAAQQTQFGNQMRRQTAEVGAATGIATGAAMGMLGGGAGAVVGAAGGAIAGAIGVNAANMENARQSQLTAMGASTNNESNRISSQAAAFVRDTNRDLAQFSARGDYANTIAGIQARVQDTMMTQPSVKGGFGGDMFRLINNHMEINLRWKMIDDAAMAHIGEFWLRYGYAINRFAFVPNALQVMTHFTYWKLSETYIKTAPMPEAYKQAIRGIFEKGVTVWKTPEDIGMIDPAINQPLEGVSY